MTPVLVPPPVAWLSDPRCTPRRPPVTKLSLTSILMSVNDVLPTPIRTVPLDAACEAGVVLGSWFGLSGSADIGNDACVLESAGCAGAVLALLGHPLALQGLDGSQEPSQAW